MDLSYSETETILADAARSFLEGEFTPAVLHRLEQSSSGFDEDSWKKIVASGWTELAAGDLQGEALQLLAVLLREMGRAALASPFFQSVAAAAVPLAQLGGGDRAARLLSAIADGAKAVLVAPANLNGLPSGTLTAEEVKFNGGPFIVEWAHVAEHLVCPVCVSEVDYVLVALTPGHPGLKIRELRSIDNERIAQVSFEQLCVGSDAVVSKPLAREAVERCMELVRLLRAIEMAGGSQRVLEMTVDYVKNRNQFGHPLATLQAVQHMCASMAMESDAAFLATCEAVSLAAQPADFSPRAALATFTAGRAYERVTQWSAQLHGGMGAMSEYPLQFYFRRAKGQRQRLGSVGFQLECVASRVVDVAARGTFPTRELLVAE